MKFRTMLLASAAVMFTSSAFAADITNPFFLPTQGKFLSDTSVNYVRFKTDDGASEGVFKGLYASETLSYGVTDNFAVVGHIGNTFDYDKDQAYNNDHNFDYALGAKYNHNFGKVLTQVSADYYTYDPQSHYGQGWSREDNDRWIKIITAQAKVGYAMDNGLTPYSSLQVAGTIDNDSNDQIYSWFAGVNKKFDKVALDGGVRYVFGDYDEENLEAWFAEASADYYVKDNFTVGVYGDYYLGGTYRKDVEYGYMVGLNAKVLF